MADMDSKGRRVNNQPKGDKCGRSKLTETQVREIKAALADGEPIPKIAKRYGVTVYPVHGIKRGKTWKHVA